MEQQANKYYLVLLITMSFSIIATSQNLILNHALVLKTLNEKGDPNKALSYYNTINIGNENNSLLTEFIANSYFLLGNYKEAANLFLELNTQDDRKCNYEMAKCFAQLNKPELSVKYLRKHLESKNKFMRRYIRADIAFKPIENSKYWKQLWLDDWYSKYDLMLEDAWNEYENKNFEDALNIIEELNLIRKSMIEAYYLKSLTYFELGEYENALYSINIAIEKRDKIPEYYAAKAKAELELNKSKKALKTIALAIEMDSSEMDYYFIRAKAYFKCDKIELAKADLEQLMTLVPDFDLYKLAGELYSEAGELQSALKAYNKCINLKNNTPEIYIARGDVYNKVFAYEFAEKDYTMALDFFPYEGELYYKRGVVRKQQHKANLACQDFHKAYKYKYMKADDELRGYCQGK